MADAPPYYEIFHSKLEQILRGWFDRSANLANSRDRSRIAGEIGERIRRALASLTLDDDVDRAFLVEFLEEGENPEVEDAAD